MRAHMKDFPLTVDEVRRLMKKEESKRWTVVAVGVGVVAILVALILWVAKCHEKDLEEHYEYFDDDFDELDENFDELDDSIYDEEEEETIEYVKLKDFMPEEEAATLEQDLVEEVAEEGIESIIEVEESDKE